VKSERYSGLKRLIDAVIAAAGLILLSPLIIMVSALVATTLGRPVLFFQRRPGRHGRPFRLVKFRSMRSVDESSGLISDADRMTRVGSLLRATSLDELPTLWNVLRGEMSLVGPRPLLMSYLERYSAGQARRHEVRPGITGLAQVRGRNALSWEQKFDFDVWYVDNYCLSVDMRIIAETFGVVLRRTGISAEGAVTAPEFLGSSIDSGAK
jgi:lipopolysaccharide/colanic/teichoic acid biosynthesis glycosyltransferase